jgi:hypothetical protein
MTNEWIPIMADGVISGHYMWTTHWFKYYNQTTQMVLLEIMDDKNRRVVRYHIAPDEFYQYNRMHINFTSITIQVKTIHGKEIFNYKTKR